MLDFRSACLVTGWLFVPLSLAVFLFTSSWVRVYVHDEALRRIGIDSFRFIAALNLIVGALLLAMARGELDPLAQRWVALVMAVGVGVLAGVHVVVLWTNHEAAGGPVRWNASLYVDTAFFTLVSLYWVAVAIGLSG